MNEKFRQFERQSHLDVYSLGLDRAAWESKLDAYTKLIIQDCIDQLRQEWYDLNNTERDTLGDARAVAILVGQKNGVLKSMSKIKKHYGVTE
jgi:hypothetical protein